MKKIILVLFALLFISSAYSLSVNLTVAPGSGNEPVDSILTANVSDGTSPYIFEWDFDGDGTIDATTNSPENEVDFTYMAGYYKTTVKVTDVLMEQAEDTRDISIRTATANWLPIANSGGPYDAIEPITETLQLNGSVWDQGETPDSLWEIKEIKGTPDCTISNPIILNPILVCNQIGKIELTLTATDNEGYTDSDSTEITIREIQKTDLINVVEIKAEPEILKTGEDLIVTVTIRNASNVSQDFQIDYEIKDFTTNTTIMTQTQTPLNIEAYDQKDFVLTITSVDFDSIGGLKPLENYWVYATATTIITPPETPETNTALNTRRAIFSFSEIRTLQVPETNLIGIFFVLLLSMAILRKR